MFKKCPVCGKKFEMLHPSVWAYNIDKKQFFCSWTCLQKHRAQKEEERLKITLEQKKKAVEIAVKGGDVMAYLRECGSENPGVTWSNIYRTLEKVDPEAYDLITCRKKANVDKGMPKKDERPTVKISGPIVIETPETNQVQVVETPEELDKATQQITQPVHYDGFAVKAISGEFGRYQCSNGYNNKADCVYIDYENHEGEEISMTVEQWRGFLAELHRAAMVLGVEL